MNTPSSRRRMQIFPASLAWALACAAWLSGPVRAEEDVVANPPADPNFEYHAYLRSGVLESGKGGKGVPFIAPGAPAKYRLGNEAETYGEAILVKDFNRNSAGPRGKVETLLAYKTLNNNQWSADTDQFSIREAYGEITGLGFAPEASVWAGSRFYQRRDIHINDFYWLDTSGYGGGLQYLKLHDTINLSLAYLRGSPDNGVDLIDVGVISKQTLDIRLAGIPVGFGTLQLVALPAYVKGGTYESKLKNGDEEKTITTQVDSEQGLGLCLVHDYNYSLGFNTLALQWGNSVAKDFGSALWATPTPVTDKSRNLRLQDFGVVQPGDSFAMMYVGIIQSTDNGQDDYNMSQWCSAGVRPTYYFNKNYSLALELGYDYTSQEQAPDQGGDLKGGVGKVTLCPQIALDNTFFARPVLRAFVTLARWDNDFKGQVGGTPYADNTHGLNFGVQMEAWF